jgi:hypothetical protein
MSLWNLTQRVHSTSDGVRLMQTHLFGDRSDAASVLSFAVCICYIESGHWKVAKLEKALKGLEDSNG